MTQSRRRVSTARPGPRAKRELHAYVGRQAIFDRRLNVIGYELLYRDSDENRARFDDVAKASATTMLNAFLEIGLDSLVGTLPAFVNMSAEFLLGDYPIPLPPERTVIEVLEDIPVTPALVQALHDLRARGFRIALDDFVLTDATRPLLSVANIIKVNVLDVPRDEIAAQYAALKPSGATLLAEKISTHEEHIFLRNLGFYYFQGYFLEMPLIARTSRMPHDRSKLLRLLATLYDKRLDLRSVEGLVAAEVGLGVRLLKVASSAALTRGAQIGSLQQAMARLGVQQVAALVVLILAAGFDDKPLELARQVLIRARMCELLARNATIPADEMFTAGLLSLLDAILDRPLPEILDQLPLSALVREALQGGASRPARIVDTVRHQNRGELASLAGTGFTAQAVFVAWYDALRWADEIMRQL
ncbi:MAG: HDOD domain-containing protein [Deltaproteobacteria bacterium]|nr:MAG: HDOD domain-containing protein [Deltaproteobacteria bacterium]TMQ27998.1 MAG: HDOD domain-containing protein [Deltaproteobacteria bacterium]